MGLELLLPLMIIVLIVLMFLQSSKQRKALKALREMQESLTVGDRVLTTSGVHATIYAVNEDTVGLEIAPSVKTVWDRRVIREKLDADATSGTTPESGSDGSRSL